MLVVKRIRFDKIYITTVSDRPYDLWFKKLFFSSLYSTQPAYFFFINSRVLQRQIKKNLILAFRTNAKMIHVLCLIQSTLNYQIVHRISVQIRQYFFLPSVYFIFLKFRGNKLFPQPANIIRQDFNLFYRSCYFPNKKSCSRCKSYYVNIQSQTIFYQNITVITPNANISPRHWIAFFNL